MKQTRILQTLLLTPIFFGAASLQAATITPNILTDPALGSDPGNCSLRYAVESIDNGALEVGCTAFSTGTLGTDDTIVLGEGTYALTLTGNSEDDNATGDLDVNNNDIIIMGAGSDLTTIDASGISDGDRIIQFEDVNAVLTGLTLTGGDVVDLGGAIDTNETNLTLQEVAVVDNQSEGGGGIFYDGDIDSDIALIIENSTIDNNIAEQTIFPNGLQSCGGGGIFISDGTTAISNSTISRNEALTGDGGGICDDGFYLFLTNSTVSNNTTNVNGGGISSAGGLKGAYNVTIAFNDAPNGAGGGVNKSNPAEDTRFTAEIFNTIIAENTAIRSPDCFGPFQTGGNNLIGQIGPNDQCTDFVDGVMDDQVGTDLAPIDPLLGPLANNGGTTETHALLEGSPAIDRGNATACQALDFDAFVPDSDDPLVFFDLTDDQRFLTRPVAILDPNVPVCDIGAYELQIAEPTPTPTPTATATPVPPFNALLEGSGCSLTALGSASASGLASIGLMALWGGLAHWALRRRKH